MSKVTHLTLDEGGGLNRRRIHLREISGGAGHVRLTFATSQAVLTEAVERMSAALG